MPRANISYGLITSQNQGGGNKKQGLPPTVGLGQFSMNIIQRKAGYCSNCGAKQARHTIVITSGGQSGQPTAGTVIFDGYIIVDTTTNLIIGVYETGDETNRLLPTNDPAYTSANNIYPLTNPGFNFESDTLQSGLNVSYNNFNLYHPGNPNAPLEYILTNAEYEGDISTLYYTITIG
jgi:hypothetical protein